MSVVSQFTSINRRLMRFSPYASATTGGDANNGHGSNGGVWEWTSTAFAGHDGLVPTDHFTG